MLIQKYLFKQTSFIRLFMRALYIIPHARNTAALNNGVDDNKHCQGRYCAPPPPAKTGKLQEKDERLALWRLCTGPSKVTSGETDRCWSDRDESWELHPSLVLAGDCWWGDNLDNLLALAGSGQEGWVVILLVARTSFINLVWSCHSVLRNYLQQYSSWLAGRVYNCVLW